jgi:hypothetical protein
LIGSCVAPKNFREWKLCRQAENILTPVNKLKLAGGDPVGISALRRRQNP